MDFITELASMLTPIKDLPDDAKSVMLEASCKTTKPEKKSSGCLKKGTGLKKCEVCCEQETGV